MITSTVKTSLLVTMMSIALFGCGSDNSSSQNSTQGDNGSNTPEGNEPEVTVDKLELNSFSVLGRTGSQTVYRNQLIGSESSLATQGHVRIFELNCNEPDCNSSFGESSNEWDQTLPAFTVYGENFSSNTYNSEIYADQTTLNFDMLDEASGTGVNYKIHYVPFDLEGHSVADSKRATQNNEGVSTVFSRLENLPSELTFPTGSVCFVAAYQQASIPLFRQVYSTGNLMNSYEDLNDWQSFIVKELGDFQTSITSQVGSDNSTEARRLVYNANTTDLKKYSRLAGQDYLASNGTTLTLSATNDASVMNATYIPKDKQYLNNFDKDSGLVDCAIVNDVAADFLEREIVKSY